MVRFYSSTSIPQPHRIVGFGRPDNLRRVYDRSSDRVYSSRVGYSGRGSLGFRPRGGEYRRDRKSGDADMEVCIEYQYADMEGNLCTTRVNQSDYSAGSSSYLVNTFNPSQRQEHLEGEAARASYNRKLERDIKTRAGRGCKGLTSRGRRRIIDGVALLERRYKHLGFYTLTCPYSEPAFVAAFNRKFPEIVRQFLQYLRRVWSRCGVNFSYVGVYEVQEKRFARTGVAALHFHFVAPCYSSGRQFIIDYEGFAEAYNRIIKKVVGEDYCGGARIGLEVVRKSASRYLSKYCSKGGSFQSSGFDWGIVLGSWYSMSSSVRVAIRYTTYSLPDSVCADIADSCQYGGVSKYAFDIRPCYREIDGRNVFTGCTFSIFPDIGDCMSAILYAEIAHVL